MIKTAIILAGGLGTRLRSVISDLPKCMAPVAGKPFLYYVIRHLEQQGIREFIFSTGYKSEVIQQYLEQEQSTINYRLSVEVEPLGTGGAIKLACTGAAAKDILVVNGDTLFSVNTVMLTEVHHTFDADCTLGLKPMYNFERYGAVELNADNSIRSFNEKQFCESGLINGGVYLLNVTAFLQEDLPSKFSFETSYLEKYVGLRKMYGVVQDEYFIDIGIPEDYEKAQRDFAGV